MDAGRYRPGPVGGGLRLADRPDAGRRAGRCRALGAPGRRHRGRRHLHQRADLCGVADLSRWCWRRRCCMRWRVACSARPLPRSASAWSAMPRSANGSAATPALPRSATAWPRPRWAPAAISSPPRAVFIVTALLLGADAARAAHDRRATRSIRSAPTARRRDRRADQPRDKPGDLMHNRPLLIFAGCLAAVSPRQRGDAAADGQRRDHALEPMGDRADRRLHRRAAARRRR